ncbi:MAG: 2-oxo acid dehydrogenase subunit E2 [Lewinella sp.]|nr:2-oxo acid dehydrogenase subunit E2 [Lewinella sp.]
MPAYRQESLSFARRMVIASASVTRTQSSFHSLATADITRIRQQIKLHREKTGERLSLTAYLVNCLARTVARHPACNSFRRGRRIIYLDDVTVNVLVERDYGAERAPEPLAIRQAQAKSYYDIHQEVRAAQAQQREQMESPPGFRWLRWIPIWLLRLFVRWANRNIGFAQRYGKVAVTAVGMHAREGIWFIPHGTATVLVTVGSISEQAVLINGEWDRHEQLHLTVSFDHDLIDGAPAARFLADFLSVLEAGAEDL